VRKITLNLESNNDFFLEKIRNSKGSRFEMEVTIEALK